MRRATDPQPSQEEREAVRKRQHRRRLSEWGTFATTMVTLAIIVIASGVYVVRADRGQEADLRAAQAEQEAACLRGEALRAYVRIDNELSMANLRQSTTLTPAEISRQISTREALLASGAFDKGQCDK